jgi:hypothetical protein
MLTRRIGSPLPRPLEPRPHCDLHRPGNPFAAALRESVPDTPRAGALTHPAPNRLRLGYLQVGPPRHGICRYGRLLAAEGRRRPDLVILEQNIVLAGKRGEDRRLLRAAARELSRADLVHLQVSVFGDGSWGQKWRALSNLREFRRHCRAPLVLTLHDVNSLASLRCGRLLHCLRRAVYESIKALLHPAVRLAMGGRRAGLGVMPAAEGALCLAAVVSCGQATQESRTGRAAGEPVLRNEAKPTGGSAVRQMGQRARGSPKTECLRQRVVVGRRTGRTLRTTAVP